MSSDKSQKGCFHYRQKHKINNHSKREFWKPGDPLREEDLELLKSVKEFYQVHKYPPCKDDLPNEEVSRLKDRFRIWKNVILAAELPYWNSGENQKIRQERLENEVEE